MKFKRLLFLGLLLLSVVTNAQTNFRPGYVIYNSGDTLAGEIDYRNDKLMSEVCRFRINSTEKEMYYSPKDIMAFRFKDDKYFISKEIEGKKIFLEFLIKGRVSIYYFRNDTGDHYFIDKEGIGISELKYEKSIKEIDGKQYEYKSKLHLGMLSFYMQDAKDFETKIADVYKPDHESLIKVAEAYHHNVCKDESCIIYEKKIPFIKFNLEIVGGSINYFKSDDNPAGSYFHEGVLVHIWMPRTDENLYFRTGILYSYPLNSNGLKTGIYKTPLQIEYVYPKGIFIPKFALGINLYRSMFQSYSAMVGFNIKVTKKINISMNYDIDFLRKTLLPESFGTHSLLTGILFKF